MRREHARSGLNERKVEALAKALGFKRRKEGENVFVRKAENSEALLYRFRDGRRVSWRLDLYARNLNADDKELIHQPSTVVVRSGEDVLEAMCGWNLRLGGMIARYAAARAASDALFAIRAAGE